MRLDEATSNVKKLAEKRLAEDKSADEFVEIVETDGFKIYATVGKIANATENGSLHENPRDVFIPALEGEIEFTFENGERTTVKAGEWFVLPKRLKHRCIFKKMTIAIEGVYEKGLYHEKREKLGK